MTFRVLLVLLLALALPGCGSKTSHPSSTDGATAPQLPSASGSNSASRGQQSGGGDDATQPVATVPGVPAAGSSGATPAGPSSPAATSTSPTSTSTTTSPVTLPTPTASTTPTSTPTSTPTVPPPPPPPPAPVTAACTVALAGLHGLGPIPSYIGACSPVPFVSSTGAPFTSIAVQVAQGAALLPSMAVVQVKDASGNVLATASGLGPLQVTVPQAAVPSTPSVPLTAEVTLTGIFTDYSALVTFTLS
ncbi:MAG: hypothetical protein ABR586_08660 [Thermoplasmatota archaeon]